MKISTLLIFSLIPLTIFAQKNKSYVKNIDLDIDGNKIVVNYDIENKSDIKSHDIQLFFVDESFNINVPKKLSGDFGSSVTTGTNKKIVWDVFKDDISISSQLTPKIVIDNRIGGGPGNIAYSILIPGLGDYMVADSKTMFFKPYMRTISALSLVGLGLYSGATREKYYLYNEIWDGERLVKKAYATEYNYSMFKYDMEIFLSAGALIWISDVVWVYIRGVKNNRLKLFANNTYTYIDQNGFNVSYTYRF